MRIRPGVWPAAALATALGIAGSAGAEGPDAEPPGVGAWDVDEDCGQLPPREPRSPRPLPAATSDAAGALDPAIPHGRAVSRLTAAQCGALLHTLGVAYEDASAEGGAVGAVEQPIRLLGPLGELDVRPHGGDARSIHAILDCRLAVALYAWAPTLRAAGFTGIEHVSVFRPGARVARSGHVSGHAHALAIDALRFVRPDGTTFSVLDDWVARERGADPCGRYDEPDEARALREAICAGAAAEIFEVIVTPHHDDLHANHVHLEVVPGVDWTALR